MQSSDSTVSPRNDLLQWHAPYMFEICTIRPYGLQRGCGRNEAGVFKPAGELQRENKIMDCASISLTSKFNISVGVRINYEKSGVVLCVCASCSPSCSRRGRLAT